MSRYSVDTDALRGAAGRCGDISNNIGYLARQASNVKYSLNNYMGRYNGVISALDNCVTNSYRCNAKVNHLGNYGIDIANKYRQTEETVLGNIISSKKMKGVAGWSDRSSSENKTDVSNKASGFISTLQGLSKFGLDILTKFGAVGKLGSLPVAYLKLLIDGKDELKAKDIGSLIKASGKTILGTIDLHKKLKGNLHLSSDIVKDIFGLAKYKTISLDSVKAGWLGRLDNFETTFKGTMKSELTPTGSKVAGWALSLIANGFSNYDEYKEKLGTANEITKGRAVAETISETLIDIGKGAAITAGIAAGCAALGVAAPAVVVGGAAVAVTTVADIACKRLTEHFTGEAKSLTEFVSDGILDNAPKLAEKAVGAVQSAGIAVAGWFNKVTGGGFALSW